MANIIFDNGEISSNYNKRNSFFRSVSSALSTGPRMAYGASRAVASTAPAFARNTIGSNAPETVKSIKDTAMLALGGPVGAYIAKSTASIIKQSTDGIFRKIRSEIASSRISRSAYSSNDDVSYEDSYANTTAKRTSTPRKTTKVSSSNSTQINNKSKDIVIGAGVLQSGEELIINKSTIKKQKTRNVYKTSSVSEKTQNSVYDRIDDPYRPLASRGFSSRWGDRASAAMLGRKVNEKDLSKKDLLFINYLSRSIGANLSKRQNEGILDMGAAIASKIGMGTKSIVYNAVPALAFLPRAGRYSSQLPNPKRIGVFNSMNMTLGMIYTALRVTQSSTHDLLYQLAVISKQGLGVDYKIKKPFDIQSMTEATGKGIRAFAKGLFNNTIGLAGRPIKNFLGFGQSAMGGNAAGGFGGGMGMMGGNNVQGKKGIREFLGPKLKTGTRGLIGSLLLSAALDSIFPGISIMGPSLGILGSSGSLGLALASGGVAYMAKRIASNKLNKLGAFGDRLNEKPGGSYIGRGMKFTSDVLLGKRGLLDKWTNRNAESANGSPLGGSNLGSLFELHKSLDTERNSLLTQILEALNSMGPNRYEDGSLLSDKERKMFDRTRKAAEQTAKSTKDENDEASRFRKMSLFISLMKGATPGGGTGTALATLAGGFLLDKFFNKGKGKDAIVEWALGTDENSTQEQKDRTSTFSDNLDNRIGQGTIKSWGILKKFIPFIRKTNPLLGHLFSAMGGGKILEKIGGEKMIARMLPNQMVPALMKGGMKFAGKSAAKKVPLWGAGVGATYAGGRILDGDPLGAFAELASGFLPTIGVLGGPYGVGAGIGASLAVEASLGKRDWDIAHGKDDPYKPMAANAAKSQIPGYDLFKLGSGLLDWYRGEKPAPEIRKGSTKNGIGGLRGMTYGASGAKEGWKPPQKIGPEYKPNFSKESLDELYAPSKDPITSIITAADGKNKLYGPTKIRSWELSEFLILMEQEYPGLYNANFKEIVEKFPENYWMQGEFDLIWTRVANAAPTEMKSLVSKFENIRRQMNGNNSTVDSKMEKTTPKEKPWYSKWWDMAFGKTDTSTPSESTSTSSSPSSGSPFADFAKTENKAIPGIRTTPQDAMKAFGKYNLSEEFVNKTYNIANKLGMDPMALMAGMEFESKFNPAIKNPGSSATGLIQFMSKTAGGLGTSTEELKGMSGVKQLDYVDKYLSERTKTYGQLTDVSDLYMSILWPNAIGKPGDHKIWSVGDEYYGANAGLDWNKDGSVTKEEASRKVVGYYNRALRSIENYESRAAEAGGIYDTVQSKIDQGTAIGKDVMDKGANTIANMYANTKNAYNSEGVLSPEYLKSIVDPSIISNNELSKEMLRTDYEKAGNDLMALGKDAYKNTQEQLGILSNSVNNFVSTSTSSANTNNSAVNNNASGGEQKSFLDGLLSGDIMSVLTGVA